jgi:hypothetical protein
MARLKEVAEKRIFGTICLISSFSEPALVADFPLLTNVILLPNLIFFRNL